MFLLFRTVTLLLGTISLRGWMQPRNMCSKHNSVCKEIHDCPEALYQLHRGIQPEICKFGHTGAKFVCCGLKHKSEEMCAKYKKLSCNKNIAKYQNKHFSNIVQSTSNIVGGREAYAKQYPHMALVGFGDKSNIKWFCTGTIISERFVLSAAHCAQRFTLGRSRWVRLGDLDIESQVDDASPSDFKIIDWIVYPQFKNTSVYNDIALLKLDRDVVFNDYIKPICLYTKDNIDENDSLIATGWGQTAAGETNSPRLLSVDLNLFSINSCAAVYGTDQKLSYGVDYRTMICAGSVDGKKDTCTGDSGGPLQLEMNDCPYTYYQVGITSFGTTNCAEPNKPGVYTKISSYIPWIESIVWK